MPEHVHARRDAAARFTEHYEVIATIEIRGQVLLEDATSRLFPDRVTVSQLDDILYRNIFHGDLRAGTEEKVARSFSSVRAPHFFCGSHPT
ncbi:hypothetical protein [Ktedonospora formicarum]|uniref:Uncharacterized protein n=1 Tax=Ktedonospora formicarum TaxID=2778364 RepID=A0A8J3IAT1_9CHLR|nr:hypothetical protein [Ktedonospora formicarum]GHO50468.1 hypothetical protein KSX_86310 [Ktedonospora formicarum]